MDHPDYTAAEEIERIEAKLFAMALEFDEAPEPPAEVRIAVQRILGREPVPGTYRCPISGRPLSFSELQKAADTPTHGRSAFHVGHITPKARGGVNSPDNTYWTSDLGNRIQGDKSWVETMTIIVEMAEAHRTKEKVSWGELVNRYRD